MPPRKVRRGLGAASSDVEGPVSTQNATKKAAAQSKNHNKTKHERDLGVSCDLLDMPTDIFFEIAHLIHPLDLLNLSWSCKEIRAFLMKKEAACIWRHCLKTIDGLPPTPKHIIEPAWATLIFTRYCTGCGLNTTAPPIWEFNVRFCDECVATKIIKSGKPFEGVSPEAKKELEEQIPLVVFTPGPRLLLHAAYLKSEVESFLAEWERISTLADEAQLNALVGERVLRVHNLKVERHILACRAWVRLQCRIRQEEKIKLAQRHLQAVIMKLRDLGWGTELEDIQANNYARLRSRKQEVYRAKILTDEDWADMREDVLNFMQEVKEARLKREFKQRLEGRFDALKMTLNTLANRPEARTCGILRSDIAFIPEIREVMCAPESVLVDEESFRAVHEAFGDMVEAWKRNAVDELRKLVNKRRKPRKTKAKGKGKKKVAEAEAVVDPLELATTLFSCENHCGTTPLFYPGILAHRCFRMPHMPFSVGKFTVRDDLVVNPRAVPKYAKQNITLCGRDPKTATASELDDLDVRLVLVKEDGKHVVTWREAIWHDHQPSGGDWRLATPEELAVTKKCEDLRRKHKSLYHCGECNTVVTGQPLKYYEAKGHMTSVHGVTRATVDHEYLTSFLPPEGSYANGMMRTILRNNTQNQS